MSTNNPHNIVVGQKLWYVPGRSYAGSSREIEVGKIGRVYFEDAKDRNGRYLLEDLSRDGRGYSSPGRCYLSREDHEAEQLRQSEWSRVARIIRDTYSAPKSVTVEDIRQAAKLLGIDP